MDRKKVFISLAVWGGDYTATFIRYSLATQLSKDNIPALSIDCDIIYHIITTTKDKLWLETQPLMILLKQYCSVVWDVLGDKMPTGVGGAKYFFLSMLQNMAMKRAANTDLIIFNYADFIWADGSLGHLVKQFEDDIDAVLSFCLPVEHHDGVDALEEVLHTTPDPLGVIDLAPRQAVNIALAALHREAKRRFWTDDKFTVTPTYILWPVDDEGVLITAYHQTILAMRVDTNDIFYHNGILTSSLDGFYSAVLAANGKIKHATNSDEIFVFSLYSTIINSAILDKTTREASIQQCLRGSVTEKQRDLALQMIEVRKSYRDENRWNVAKTNARDVLMALHEQTPFDPILYNKIYFNDQINPCASTIEVSAELELFSSKKSIVRRLVAWGARLGQRVLVKLFVSKNITRNGNFQDWSTLCLEYREGAWIPLPALHWLGHFDFGAAGQFQQSTCVPNELSQYSMLISGAKNGEVAYLAQKISDIGMLGIRQAGSFSCSGYIRCEGDVDRIVPLTLMVPNLRNDFTAYTCTTLDYIEVKQVNRWEHFELFFDGIITEKQIQNGAMFHFQISGLDAPENKIYFSQIKIESSTPTPFSVSSLSRVSYFERKYQFLVLLHAKKREFMIRYKGNVRRMFKIQSKNAPRSLDMDYMFWLLTDNHMEKLVALLARHVQPVQINQDVSLDHQAAAYYWIGLLPERVMNTITDFSMLSILLTRSEFALRELIAQVPLFVDAYRALARNLWMQGRHNESLAQFQNAEMQRIEFAHCAAIDLSESIVLPTNCAHVIGLMGHLDAFIKKKILMNDHRTYYMNVQPTELVNSEFFNYWEPHVQLGLPKTQSSAAVMTMACTVDWNWAMPETSSTMAHVHTSIARIQRQWAREERPPLLTLSSTHLSQLEKYKRSVGMKQGDWYVCLHVRSQGFYEEVKGSAQDFRNTLIDDYSLAIKAIVDAGGWVFRMGDDKSPQLQLSTIACDSNKIIDYAHSRDRCAALDVALSGDCRLFVASPSGLHTVAHAFGRPVCYVNYPIYAGFPWHENEIFTPMLYYCIASHRILSMNEILASNLVYADHQHLLTKERIVLLRNTPDEIEQTVLQALQAQDYALTKESKAIKARDCFEALNAVNQRDISGQLSLYFAMKYSDVLFPDIKAEPSHFTKRNHVETETA